MKKSKLFGTLILVVVLFAFCGCNNKKTNTEDATQKDPLKSLDGKNLFEQIMFFEGDLAKEITFVKDVRAIAKLDSFNEDQQAAWSNYKNYITKYIEKYHSTFFDEFGSMLHSGNPLLVEKAISEAGEHVICAMALQPLLILRNDKIMEATLSDEEKKIISQLTSVKNLSEFKKKYDELNVSEKLWDDLFIDRAVNLNLNLHESRDLDYFRYNDVNLYKYIDFYLNRSFDLDRAINKYIDYNRIVEIAPNIALDIKSSMVNSAIFFHTSINYDLDLAYGAFFFKTKSVSHDSYLNYNTAVNVWKYVNVAVALNLILPLTYQPGTEKNLLQEEYIRDLTERLSIIDVRAGYENVYLR